MKNNSVIAHENDNVVTVYYNINVGDEIMAEINNQKIKTTAKDEIPKFHKAAIKTINAGENVIKYGEVIGKANSCIELGSYVHVHNIESNRGRGDTKNRR